MKEMIPRNEHGLFADMNGTAWVDSLSVAKEFGKQHKYVLDRISKITEPTSLLSARRKEFVEANFAKGTYTDSTGRRLPCYFMTEDGFSLLIMGFTGDKAMELKIQFIERFKEMRAFIRSLLSARQQFPLLTEQIQMAHNEVKSHHFSNECDMLNRIVLGMTAKQFKIANGLPEDTKSIRPYLTSEQIRLLDALQTIDCGLLITVPDFQERKKILTEWHAQHVCSG